MNKYRTAIIAGGVMLILSALGDITAVARCFQLPSGWLASFFLGAPTVVDGDNMRILTAPLVIVSEACSGIHFFAFIAGLGSGYWCGVNIRRWMLLLPASYLITLFANAARIAMAWQFRRFSNGHLTEWLQIYIHIGIGIVCFLSITAILLYFIKQQPLQRKETP